MNFEVLPTVLQNLTTEYLDNCSYLQLTCTNKNLRKLRKNKNIKMNSSLHVIKTLKYIFDKKRNVFLTGSAGTGKSYLLNKIIKIAKRESIRIIATATTGMACLNLPEGKTIHSFSGLRKGTIPKDKLLLEINNFKEKTERPKKYSQWKDYDLLLIDEISMLGCRMLEKLNMVAQYGRSSSKIFGGIQVVFCGDFLQLPPVGDKMIITHDLWNKFKFININLQRIYRQDKDLEYLKLLQRLRMGNCNESDLNLLKMRCEMTRNINFDDREIKPIQLFSVHTDVNRVNQEEFNKIKRTIIATGISQDSLFQKKTDGQGLEPSTRDLNTVLQKMSKYLDVRLPHVIEFKEGAQYILTYNIDTKNRQVNGSRCVFKIYNCVPILEFENSTFLPLEKTRITSFFSVFNENGLFLKRKQFALRLGYARSIHAIQGATHTEVLLDLGKSIRFNAQAYVGLSRVTSLNGLYLKDFVEKSLKTHKEAKEFYEKLEQQVWKK